MSSDDAREVADRAESYATRSRFLAAVGTLAYLYAGPVALGFAESPLPDIAISILTVGGVILFMYGLAGAFIGEFFRKTAREYSIRR